MKITEQTWNNWTAAQRLEVLAYNFPFDYLLCPNNFQPIAQKTWDMFNDDERDFLTYRSVPNTLTK